MKRALVLLAVLGLVVPAWAGVPGVPRVQGVSGGDTVPVVVSPSDTTVGSTAISAVCIDANINACGANSTVSISVSGQGSASAKVVTSTFTSTLVADYSTDGGNTWTKGWIIRETRAAVSSVAFAADSGTYQWVIFGGSSSSHLRLRANATVTNTAAVTLRAGYYDGKQSLWEGVSGQALPPSVTVVAGSDGASTRALLTDSTGKLQVGVGGAADTVSGPTALSAACADGSINSCGANSTVQVTLAGEQGCGFTIPASSSLVATIKVDLSWDNSTWLNTTLLDAGGNSTASLTTAGSTVYNYSVAVAGGARYCRVRASAVTSGTANVSVIATTVGSIGNAVQVATADVVVSGTLSSACTTSTCAANQTVAIPTNVSGQTYNVTVTSVSTPTGFTVLADCSYDGGTTWQLGFGNFEATGSTYSTSLVNANLTAGAAYSVLPCDGASNIRVRASAVTSGSVVVAMRATSVSAALEPIYVGATGVSGGVPPASVSLGSQDATNNTTLNTVQSATHNTTPVAAKFVLTMPGFFRSAISAGTAANVGALSIDATTGFLNLRLNDAATYTGANVTALAGTIGNGLQVLPAVARASTTADTVTTSQALQVSSVTGALFTGITGAAAAGTPADVLATNSAGSSSLRLSTNPAIGRSAVSGVTNGNVGALAVDTTTGFQLVNLSDGATYLKASVLANDTTAALNHLSVGPAIARATPTAVTAARGEMLQVDTTTGGVYDVPVTTTAAVGTSTGFVAATGATSVKGSAGNVYGVYCLNTNASTCHLNFFNSAPTCGTTTPVWSVPLASNGTAFLPASSMPLANHSSSIQTCQTTGFNTAAAVCGAAMLCEVFYK